METHEKYLDTYRVLVRTSWPVADSSSVTPCAHLRAARLGPSSPVRSSWRRMSWHVTRDSGHVTRDLTSPGCASPDWGWCWLSPARCCRWWSCWRCRHRPCLASYSHTIIIIIIIIIITVTSGSRGRGSGWWWGRRRRRRWRRRGWWWRGSRDRRWDTWHVTRGTGHLSCVDHVGQVASSSLGHVSTLHCCDVVMPCCTLLEHLLSKSEIFSKRCFHRC